MFDDAFTHRIMAEELKESLEKLDELYSLINQFKYPLLH